MRFATNPHLDVLAVERPRLDAAAFHHALPGYRPTPVHELPALADELGLAAVAVKDESDRLGLPAFKVLGASWAAQRALARAPETVELVAASAGNHGRAVAHVAAARGLRCRIFLPARSLPRRRAAIASEGAEVVVVDGTYEDAVALAAAAGAEPATLEIADVGTSDAAHAVIDGYATLFSEAGEQAACDLLLVPVGVGSLAAAAARFGAARGAVVVGVEPVTAACLTASLAAGEPTAVPTPGTTMAGLDCAAVSPAAWPTLRAGIAGTVTVDDAETAAAMAELAMVGMAIGESGAAPLAALRALGADPHARRALDLGPGTRVLLIATEGRTGTAFC